MSDIYEGDCIEVMNGLPESCADLAFIDPPYYMDRGTGIIQRPEGGEYEGVTDDWDKFSSLDHYVEFTESWLSAVKRLLKPVSSLWVIGDYHCIHTIGYCMMKLGWFILNDIVWVKPNPVPQMRGVRFCNSIETLIWAVPGRKHRYTFNYHEMKELNGGKQMRADWNGISICIGNERIKGTDGKKVHSTQKPEKLLERVILSTTKLGDTILDPFFGTGTTGAVAHRLGRDFIGIEREKSYLDVAVRRLDV